MDSRPGLAISVRDARTGGLVPEPVTLVLREGQYEEKADSRSGLNSREGFLAAWDRGGTYRVEIRAPGYRPWTREGVHVPSDGCHVETIKMRAQLEPDRGAGRAREPDVPSNSGPE